MPENHISQNLISVKKRIEEICRRSSRDPGSVRLVAVSKTKPVTDIKEAIKSGQKDFGENQVQELASKMEQFGDEVIWHMIGTLQTNKIKYLVSRVDWIHSVPKIKSLHEIEKRAARAGRKIKTLIQVNISDESQKSGCEPSELRELLAYAAELKWVEIRGLMGIASLEANPETVRPQFRLLRELRDQHRSSESANIRLDELSMGMTHDFEVAIEEGATMVRVGSAIFGKRNH